MKKEQTNSALLTQHYLNCIVKQWTGLQYLKFMENLFIQFKG